MASQATDTDPVALPLSRYEKMADRSPFAVASESAPVNLPAAGFAKDIVLTGAVHLSNGDYITIASRDQSQSFSLRTGTVYNGFSLVNVAWSDAIGKTRATIKCGTEFAIISFDEAMLRQSPSAADPVKAESSGTPKPILPPGVKPPKIPKR
jgi:hypothetical protein